MRAQCGRNGASVSGFSKRDYGVIEPVRTLSQPRFLARKDSAKCRMTLYIIRRDMVLNVHGSWTGINGSEMRLLKNP